MKKNKFQFYMITNNLDIASMVIKNGVDKIFIDLETLGKKERQGHLDTWISQHTFEDISNLKKNIPGIHILTRVNPINKFSEDEINEAFERGSSSIMLPMFSNLDEVGLFYEYLKGRCLGIPLFETYKSILNFKEIITSLNIKDLHFGLNDLHLDLKMKFIFEPLLKNILEEPCEILRNKKIKFGIGGLARSKEGFLSPEVLLGEHVRLGSTRAILSRTFHRNAKNLHDITSKMNFKVEINRLKKIHNNFVNQDIFYLNKNKHKCDYLIQKLINS